MESAMTDETVAFILTPTEAHGLLATIDGSPFITHSEIAAVKQIREKLVAFAGDPEDCA